MSWSSNSSVDRRVELDIIDGLLPPLEIESLAKYLDFRQLDLADGAGGKPMTTFV